MRSTEFHNRKSIPSNVTVKALLLVSVVLLVFVSCDKDNGPKPWGEILIGTTWQLVAHTSVSDGQTENRFETMNPCELDNFFRFEKGGKIIFDDGAVKCHPADPQTVNGTWQIVEDRLILEDELSHFAVIFIVRKVSETQLILEQRYQDQNSMEAVSTFTYEPK